MAFPNGWNHKARITCTFTAEADNVPLHISHTILLVNCADILTTGALQAARSDGGDIRFSLDALGAQQLACEVALFEQAADPANAIASIWVKIPSLTNGLQIYVWWGNPLQAKDAAASAYGSIAVWEFFDSVWHFEEPVSDADIGVSKPPVFRNSKTDALDLIVLGPPTGVTRVPAKTGRGALGSATPHPSFPYTGGKPIDLYKATSMEFATGDTFVGSFSFNAQAWGPSPSGPSDSPCYTVELFWIYAQSSTTQNNIRLRIRVDSNITPPFNARGPYLEFTFYNATTGGAIIYSPTPFGPPWIPAGDVHLGFVFTFGTGSSFKLYINGTLAGVYVGGGNTSQAPIHNPVSFLRLSDTFSYIVRDETRFAKNKMPDSDWASYFAAESQVALHAVDYVEISPPESGMTITGGGDVDAMQTPRVVAAGAGIMSPPYSRLMPGATGSISHARIIKSFRSSEQAAHFHGKMGGN